MADAARITRRIDALAEDGNLDLEDVAFALLDEGLGGPLSVGERHALAAALSRHDAALEPAARRFLVDLLAGRSPLPVTRVLLAPHPRGEQPDLYYPRAEVVSLQEALDRLGHACEVDGLYGPGTTACVRAFQGAAGLKATGVVDSATLAALNGRLEAAGHALLDLSPRARIRPDRVVALRGHGPKATVEAIQRGLDRLARHFGLNPLRLTADGVFGPATEKAVAALQARAYLPQTGLLDTATLRALDAALEAVGLPVTGVARSARADAPADAPELHFYPGDAERKVYVLSGERVLATYGMVGGRAEAATDPKNPHVPFDPSPEGVYEVTALSPHASRVWPYSYVPYGAELRFQDGEVAFRGRSGDWHLATGPEGVFAGRTPPPLGKEAYLDADGALPTRWLQNDFGHLRARLRSLQTGLIQTHMIHPTSYTESTATYFDQTDDLLDPGRAVAVLRFSHGCEHIHPRDLDDMVARGYLAPGTKFVVHGYDELFSNR